MARVELHDDALREFFKSEPVKGVLRDAAGRVAASANTKARSVMHTPSLDVYEPGVRLGRNCAIGVVYARSRSDNHSSLGPAIEAKYHCLRDSLK